MGTLTITAAGFANLAATAPAGWNPDLTWPANASPNGTKTYTISDADWQFLLVYQGGLVPAGTKAPTASSLLLQWVNTWIGETIVNVQQYFTAKPTVPTAISIQ